MRVQILDKPHSQPGQMFQTVKGVAKLLIHFSFKRSYTEHSGENVHRYRCSKTTPPASDQVHVGHLISIDKVREAMDLSHTGISVTGGLHTNSLIAK